MIIKVVKRTVEGFGAGRADPTTDTIIARLSVLRKRSQKLLCDMQRLDEQFRKHSDRNGHTAPPILPAV